MKILPEFVHRKYYSNYYLFSDCEILLDKKFSERIKSFSKNVKGKKITVEMVLTKESESFIQNKFVVIPNNETNSFEKFNKQYIDLGKGGVLFYSSFNFYVFDETKKWELYCSSTQDIAIFGCDKSILNVFLNIFKPYDEESFEEKMNWIGNFCKESYRSEYLNELKKNYQFTD